MNDNKNNNENNNYVVPETVDLSKVSVDQTNKNALNRERDNIISASIQANQAVDEKSAKDVNNTIKIKKKNPVVSFLIGAFFIALACGLAFVGFKLLEGYIKEDDAKYTTTTTTTKKVNFFQSYTFDDTKLRKFQDENSILILLPKLAMNNSRYIYTVKDENGLLKREEGTYNIQNKQVNLVSSEAISRTYAVGESSLESSTNNLTMYDQELKYYVKKSTDIDSILIINATLDNSFAYIYELDNHSFNDYTENNSDISLSNGMIFVKSGLDLNYNDSIYTIVSQ